ncbi:60S ribosomal protein L9 [Thelohanellus kitauei]|uniref:Large ribosomal subunit protein uL6 n=1 Tax=Thelohanellus kitauei TaxID=669202 RepID=A0A0C2JHA5_THEKT|nr:60S ribosomal protein L9 [Thelohanellus kitauei]
MRVLEASDDVIIPPKVSAIVKGRKVQIKGPRGVLEQDFSHMRISIKMVAKKKINVSVWFGRRRDVECMNTTASLIRNMIKGVLYGIRYKMRLVYAHYPIILNPEPEKRKITIKNYIGQKRVMRVQYPEGVSVFPSDVKDEIIVEGNDLRNVSLAAARIHQKVRVSRQDIRKFLDGIYITDRTTIVPMD